MADRKDKWKVLFPLGLATAFSLMGDSTMYAVLPTHTLEAGISLSVVGILLGANRAIRILSNTLAGTAYDRWPRRLPFLISIFTGSISPAGKVLVTPLARKRAG